MFRGSMTEGISSVLLTGQAYQNKFVPSPANDNGRGGGQGKTVTIRRKLEKSGLTVKFKVPVAEFIGVAVATRISEDGELTSAIELVHPNEEFTYRVYEETGNTDVVAEWQNWGRQLRLPLYIRAGDGSLVAYSQQIDGVAVGENHSRRMLSADAERRTRFARRRKPGERLA